MRIAVVNDTVYPFAKGGAQKRVYEISRRLVQRGHDVHWYGMDYGAAEIDGIRLHAVSPLYKMYTSTGRRKIWQVLNYTIRLRIKERVDIIDCMNFPYLHCFRAKESAMRQRVPLIITWFEFWGDYWYKYMGRIGWTGKIIEQIVTHLPNKIIADSDKVKQQLVGAKVGTKKIRVVPDGVDVKLISSVCPSKDKYDVVYVGRILAHKNVDVLIRTVAKMEDVTMAIIGTGSSENECKSLSAGLGLDKRVRFFGHIAKDVDVYSVIKSAKVLVLPSTQEGHPLVIPEANASGVPVIAIKGVCDEFVKHGETGYLSRLHEFPMGRLIARAIDLYPKFRVPCIKNAVQYDWEIITDKVEAIYRELI